MRARVLPWDLGGSSECRHIARTQPQRFMLWQSRKPRKQLIFSELLLPGRMKTMKTWAESPTLCSMLCLCNLGCSPPHDTGPGTTRRFGSAEFTAAIGDVAELLSCNRV